MFVTIGDKIYYSVSGSGKELLTKNHLALTLNDAVLGKNPKLVSTKKAKGQENITPYIPKKFSMVKSVYNSLDQ